MAAKYLVSSTSPLKPAVEHILSLAKIPAERLDATAASFGVQLESTATGITPLIRALAQSGASPQEFFAGPAGPENQAMFNQWVTVAAQVASRALEVDTVETLVGNTPSFLAATSDATVADLLLYSAVINDVATDSRRLPHLAQWCNYVSSSPFIQPIKRAGQDTAAGASSGNQGGGNAQSQQPAKPNAEEIERRRIEKEKAKAEKSAAAAAAATSQKPADSAAAAVPQKPAAKSSEVDSTQLDVRVGQITSISKHPEAEKLFVESIDLGNGEVRTIVSGLVEHYKAEELQGALCLVVCNMKPKALKGVTSQGMVLCASTEAPAALELVRPSAGTAPGTRVAFGGRLAPAPPPIPSNTVIVELLAQLRTDESGAVAWKDQPASAAGVAITTSIPKAVVK